MKNVFAGLAFFVTGLIIWFVSSIGQGISNGLNHSKSGPTFFMKLGFIFMIGGPVLFWIIRPINQFRKNRKSLFFNILYYTILSVTIIFVLIIIFKI